LNACGDGCNLKLQTGNTGATQTGTETLQHHGSFTGAARRLHASLLCGVSFLACGAIAGRPVVALAQTVTVSSPNTQNSTGANIYIDPNVVLSGTPGVTVAIATQTIANQGTIKGSTTYGVDNADLIGTLSNAQAATIAATDAAVYNRAAAAIGTIDNSGLLQGGGNNYGIDNLAGASITVLINESGGAITGGLSDIQTDGIINTLTNSGVLAGGEYGIGIDAQGSVGQITNNNTINGSNSGLFNNNQLGTLTNNGTIYGADYDGFHNIGTVAAIINLAQATIYGNNNGFENDGTAGSISNAATGTISSLDFGIQNTGSIGSIANSGLIHGDRFEGIYNTGSGTVAALANAAGGVISGASYGIYTEGVFGVLANGGTITGPDAGIYNLGGGSIATLGNATQATISGNDGLLNAGTVTALSNSGLISGLTLFGVLNTIAGGIGTLTNITGGTISGSEDAVHNEGTIGGLTNEQGATIISATSTGVYNDDTGTIALLTNNGTITGAVAGAGNDGSITAVTNGGLISGVTGIYDDGGTIGALNNTGTITGMAFGIANAAASTGIGPTLMFFISSIGQLTNSGTISGGTYGVYNEGTVAQLTNSGLITGGTIGVYNAGAISGISGAPTGGIGTLTNSGTISGGFAGIGNEGTIGAIDNTGLITGGAGGIGNEGTIGVITNGGEIYGSVAGIYSTIASGAVIGQIINTGTISGGTGIHLAGGGTTITNTGTITGTGGDAIYFGGADTLVVDTGSVIEGTIDGGGAGGQIILNGSGDFTTPIADFGPGSGLDISPGADWSATGGWDIATVTNQGVFQPGVIGTPLTLTGNYVQTPSGTLRVLVTPTQSSVFAITGTAALAGGVTYILAPGSYHPHIYPFLTATAGVTGAFTTINYGPIPPGLASTTYTLDPSANLVLSGPFDVASIVTPADDTIFSDEQQALAQATDSVTLLLLDKAIQGGAAASAPCAAEAPLAADTGAASESATWASRLASAFCGAGGWIEATGSLGHVDASAGAPAYNANTAGFIAGIDKVVDPSGTRLGLSVGYDETYLNDKAGGSGSMGTTRVSLYASQPLGVFTLAGVIGYGNAGNHTARNSGIGTLSENNSESIFSGGAEITTEALVDNINIEPAAGIEAASVGGASFAEGAGGGEEDYFAVAGKAGGYTSLRPFVLVQASEDFVSPSQMVVTPDLQVGYQYELDKRGIATFLTSADGTGFTTPHNDLDPSDFLVSAGISAGKDNWALFATYTAQLSGNWTTQTGEAGLRIRF
jgi:uncharacterized protein with beta-barrel porin domain